MAKRVRMTVFSRFLLMMVIVAPLAYIGASYYNGEDGIQNIINLFNKGKERISQTKTNDASSDNAPADYEVRKLKEELDYKQKRLDELYEENEDLQRRLKKCEGI